MLVADGSHGHAFALAILAEEELGKAHICFLAAEGLVRIEGRWLKNLYTHEAKQAIQAGLTFLSAMIFPMFSDALELSRSPEFKDPKAAKKIRKDWFRRHLKRLEEAARDGTPEAAEFQSRMKWFDKMDLQKQRGLYVDFNDDGVPISPVDVAEETAQEYLKEVEDRLEVAKVALGKPLSREQKTELRKFQTLQQHPSR